MIGALIDNYRITEKIGDGGMGSVYKAVDVMLEREVALKFLRPELAQQPDLVERFRAEAVVLARLNHQNIAALYGLHRHGNDFFMAMEYVPGLTVESLLKQEGRLPVAQAAALAGLVLDALEYAHGRGVVHRDIKAANVIVSPGGGVKVMDFGIARVLGTERRTRVGFVVGTIGYMAPEQIQGLDVDGRTDLYALGVMLYEMLTGRMPFQGDTEYSVMQAQIQQMPVPPRVYAEVPVPVENTIMRSLAKLPQERFQTAAEFQTALREAVRTSAMYPAMTPPIAAASDETREFKSDPHLVAAAPPPGTAPSYPLPPSGAFPSPPGGWTPAGSTPGTPAPLQPAAAAGEHVLAADAAATALFPATPATGYPAPSTPSGQWPPLPVAPAGDRPGTAPATPTTPPPLPPTAAVPAVAPAPLPPAPSGAAVTAAAAPPPPPVATDAAARQARPAAAAKTPPVRAARKPGSTSVFFVAGSVLLALVLAGVAYRFWQQRTEEGAPDTVAEAVPTPAEPTSLAPPIEPSVPTVPVAPPAAPSSPAPPSSPQQKTTRPAAPAALPRTSLPAPSAEPVPSPVPPTLETPQLAAPAEAPQRPALPPAMFGNAKWMQVEGSRVRENGGFLQITDAEIRVLDDRGRAVLVHAPFGSVSQVHYSSGKRPTWRKDLGPVPIESAFESTIRTFHYLAFQGPAQFLLVRVDKDDLPRLRDELKKRAGLLIE